MTLNNYSKYPDNSVLFRQQFAGKGPASLNPHIGPNTTWNYGLRCWSPMCTECLFRMLAKSRRCLCTINTDRLHEQRTVVLNKIILTNL